MVKRPILDSGGKQVGEIHMEQPEYNYNPNGTKTPTGKVYLDDYHLDGDYIHYLQGSVE